MLQPPELANKVISEFNYRNTVSYLQFDFTLPSFKAQRILITQADSAIRACQAEDGIPCSNFSNAIVTEDCIVWLSTTSGIARMSVSEIEDFGSEYGISLIRHLHYDR